MHDVPVLLLGKAELQAFDRQAVPPMGIMLQVHSDDPLKAVVDRLRGLSKHLMLELHAAGALAVLARNELVAAKSFFPELTRLPIVDDDGRPREAVTCETKVDAKQLSRVLLACTSCKGSALVIGASIGSVLFVHMRLPRKAGGVSMMIPILDDATEVEFGGGGLTQKQTQDAAADSEPVASPGTAVAAPLAAAGGLRGGAASAAAASGTATATDKGSPSLPVPASAAAPSKRSRP